MSGDYTLEATDASIKELAQEEADEHFLVVLSDANLERYGIRPERFANVLTSDPEVNAFVIFIGSLGDQAERWGWNLLLWWKPQFGRDCRWEKISEKHVLTESRWFDV